MFKFEVALSDDKQSIQLTMPDSTKPTTMNVLALEEFMRELAVVRTNMEPSMPQEDPKTNTLFSSVPCRRWYVMPDPQDNSRVRLFLQHSGFGWVWLSLAEPNANQMIAALQASLRNPPKPQ